MRDDATPPNLGQSKEEFDKKFFYEAFRSLELFFTKILSLGPIRTSSVTINGEEAITEAPIDGNIYARFDGTWFEIPGVGGISPTEYTYNTTITAPPGTGTLRLNNANQTLVTTIWVHDVNAPGVNVSNVMNMLLPGNTLLLQDKTTAANYRYYTISGPITDSGSYTTIPVTYVSGGSAVTAGRVMLAALGLGSTTSGKLVVTDGLVAPVTIPGFAQIYVDAADGDLKIRFGDGVLKTIVVDT